MDGPAAEHCPDRAMLEAVAGGLEPTPSLSAHLQGCDACRAELDSMRGALDLLGEAVGLAPDASSPSESRVPGYRLLEELHRGGQGVVWTAEQEGTRRLVAIKMPLHGRAATSEQRRRFDREVEVVASLRDPAIVTIFERGTTVDGEPYYAMEFVEGRRFDAWVGETHPSVGVAVAMVARIAEAVGTAHRRGIIHRDLKPGNILVDGDGVPRVLDFGLARLETERDPDASMDEATIEGAFLGNFAYAAPEQLSGSPQAVDTTADVYALGLLLYEAITRRRAFPEPKSVMDLVGQRIDRTPPRPSSVAGGIGSELDLIVLRALDPEPDRRYATGGEFADDLKRLLDGRPVLARGDGFGYVLWKLARRHAVPTSIGAASLVVILISLVALIVKNRESERRLVRAESVAEVYESAFMFLDPQEEGAMDLRAPDLLRRFVETADTVLGEEPRDQANMLLLAGNSYANLELIEEAAACFERALELETAVPPVDPARIAAIEHGLGRVAYFRGRTANRRAESAVRAGRIDEASEARAEADQALVEAVRWYAAAVGRRRSLGAEALPDLALTLQHLANTTYEQVRGRNADDATLAAIEGRMLDSLRTAESVEPRRPELVAGAWNSVASIRETRGDPEGAIDASRRAAALVGDLDRSAWAGRAQVGLGTRLHRAGRHEEAVEPLRRGIEICEAVYGPESSITRRYHPRLVEALYRAGEIESVPDLVTRLQVHSGTSEERLVLECWRIDALVTLDRRREAIESIRRLLQDPGADRDDRRLRVRLDLLEHRETDDREGPLVEEILDRWRGAVDR